MKSALMVLHVTISTNVYRRTVAAASKDARTTSAGTRATAVTVILSAMMLTTAMISMNVCHQRLTAVTRTRSALTRSELTPADVRLDSLSNQMGLHASLMSNALATINASLHAPI